MSYPRSPAFRRGSHNSHTRGAEGFCLSRFPSDLSLACGRWARGRCEAGCESRTPNWSSRSIFPAIGAGVWSGGKAKMRIQEDKGSWVSHYLRRQRSDSSLGAAVRSSDKSPRPAQEEAAGPGTVRPGPRAPPGTEALRPPTPRSCPGHPGLQSSLSRTLTAAGLGRGKAAPRRPSPQRPPAASFCF